MEYTKIIFYIFASWAILASLLTVFARNTARAALFLVWAFFSFASLWILIGAEFLAVILILVYVGAVMVLFLFVIKMLNIDKSTLRAKFASYLPLGILISILIIAQMTMLWNMPQFDIVKPIIDKNYNNIIELANLLYTKYAFIVELAAIILLIAIIATISLVHKKSIKRKQQNINKQVNIKADDRLRIIKDNKKN